MSGLTREEAIEEIKRWTPILLNSGQCTEKTSEAQDMAISALNKSGNKWISVYDMLPEDGAWAIFTDGSTISIERYKADAIDHFYPQGRWFSFDNATAWMPLPDPYKEGEEDK